MSLKEWSEKIEKEKEKMEDWETEIVVLMVFVKGKKN